MDDSEPFQRTVTGPRRNVPIPRELADYMDIRTGSTIHLMVNPDKPGTVVLVPPKVMSELIRKGWSSIGY